MSEANTTISHSSFDIRHSKAFVIPNGGRNENSCGWCGRYGKPLWRHAG